MKSECSINVELGPRSYEIRVVSGQQESFGLFVRSALERTWTGASCRAALIVTDSHVAELAISRSFEAGLVDAGLDTAIAVVPAGEAAKSLREASRLYDELVRTQADRHTLIVALGGGVIGDLGGFVAATFARTPLDHGADDLARAGG